MRSAALFGSLLFLIGCASTAPVLTAAPVDAIHAPPPFSAEEIRDATRPGRTYSMSVVADGQPPIALEMKFVEVSPEGAVVARSVHDAQGAPLGEVQTMKVTWAELVGHALWPKDAVEISPASVRVPAGEFEDAVLYTVRGEKDGKPMVTRAWFARKLPGAPMSMVVEVGGHEVSRLTVVRHVPGS